MIPVISVKSGKAEISIIVFPAKSIFDYYNAFVFYSFIIYISNSINRNDIKWIFEALK